MVLGSRFILLRRTSFSLNKDYWIGTFLFAFTFSWLSQLLISAISGNNFIEGFVFLSFYFLSRSNKQFSAVFQSSYSSDLLFKGCVIATVAFIIGLVESNGNFVQVYPDYRSGLIFLFIFVFFTSAKWKNIDKEKFVIHVLSMITIMDLITLKLRPFFGMDFTKQTISIVAPSILSVIFLKKRQFFFSLFFWVAMCYEAVMAFYRNYYVICILISFLLVALVLQFFLKKSTSVKVKMRSAIFVVSIIVLIIFSSGRIYDYWMSDSSKMIHSINRTTELLEGGSEETERINSLLIVFENPMDFFLPRGLGWRAFQNEVATEFKNYHIISTMDSCILYLAYHYGLIILLVFLLFFLFEAWTALFIKRSGRVIDQKTQIVFLLLFIFSFLTQGIIFSMFQASFIYGVLLALVFKPI
jgi:hypothetical protein